MSIRIEKLISFVFDLTGMDLDKLFAGLGLDGFRERKHIEQSVSDFQKHILERYRENPDFEKIMDFWKANHIFEELFKIRYSLDSKFEGYDDFKKYLKEQSKPDGFNETLSEELMNELKQTISLTVSDESNFSQSDIAVMGRLQERTVGKIIENRSIAEELKEKIDNQSEQISDIYEILKTFEEFGVKNNITTSRQLEYIQKSKIENFKFFPPAISSFSFTFNADYQYNYHLFNSFEFEGDFGKDPTVYLIYSNDDRPIQIDTSSQGLQSDNLTVLKFEAPQINGSKYKYQIKKEYNYYSNISEFDIRPFILVIFGEEVIGFATITIINKSFKKGTTVTIPYTGTHQFTPQGRKLIWPLKKDLLKKLHEPQTGRVFYLEPSVVDNIISIKKYFLDTLKNEVRDTLQKEYD